MEVNLRTYENFLSWLDTWHHFCFDAISKGHFTDVKTMRTKNNRWRLEVFLYDSRTRFGNIYTYVYQEGDSPERASSELKRARSLLV